MLLRHGVLGSFLALWVGLLPAQAAAAEQTLDQGIFFDSWSFGAGARPGQPLAQTFRVGITGQLTQIDLFLRDQSDHISYPTLEPFRIDVRPVTDGMPSADPDSALTSAEHSVFDLPHIEYGSWRAYRLPPIDVHAGQQLAIVITPTVTPVRVEWFADPIVGGQRQADYEGGMAFRWSGPGGFEPNRRDLGGADFGFRTYVTPTVPEPCGLLVLFTTAVLMSRRRRGVRT